MRALRDSLYEVFQALTPVVLLIIVVQIFLVRLPMPMFLQFAGGAFLVFSGLTLFLLGIHVGILPMGEAMGAALPKLGRTWLVILFVVILGFVVTVAEPDVRILASQVDMVSNGTISSSQLIICVGIGVAIFLGFAVLRVLKNWSLNRLLLVGYGLIFLIASVAPSKFIPISLDAGGVTTGPMTVPFILSLGIGITSVLRGKRASSDGFGMVALASIGPVLAVMLLAMVLK